MWLAGGVCRKQDGSAIFAEEYEPSRREFNLRAM
jgi:hypothetical protein